MQRSLLEVELLTPCFLGGAEPTQKAEWRSASIRGQLRWWLRAVAGGYYRGDLEEVRRVEVEWLGRTDRQSPLKVETFGNPLQIPDSTVRWGSPFSAEDLARYWGLTSGSPTWEAAVKRLRLRNNYSSNPLLYLGYGCLSSRSGGEVKIDRACLGPGQRAMIRVQDRRKHRPRRDEHLWQMALWAWLHLGGIGSRSRRGFGALQLLGASSGLEDEVIATRAAFEARVGNLLSIVGASDSDGLLPSWSHFSRHSGVFLGKQPSSSWEDALVRAGAWMMAFRRRYGLPSDSRPNSGDERNWLRDRDYSWGKQAGTVGPPKGIPDRAGFGLPLPFGRAEIVTWGELGADNRRASPLLISVVRLDKKYFPVFTHLPAELVPAGEQVRFKGLPRPSSPPTPRQKGIVSEFLSDLETKTLIRRIG